ncbi:MAG TPA: ABC transporter permease [Candidatus Lachnoclostridium stercoravium]|uniref:ABC transporter permease n=1 Tax=Candidatus Lachnoclostridium stercoravium TaxID=2838633 RepID=A0A9D2HJA3_9FIRM|nr:ABC transporter permease [Candidatus Lachnoclostridium stercoravium]
MERIIVDGLSFSLPLFIMAIGGIYSEKSGIVNLSLEGFQGFGAFTGAFAAVFASRSFGADATTAYVLAILFAVIGACVYSLLYALVCIQFKANQTISGVVLNILATALTAYLTKFLNKRLFEAASDKFVLEVSSRITVPGLSEIPVLGYVFTDIYPFEILIVIVAVIAWYVLYKTPYGMNLRACGDNPHAVDAAGLPVGRIRLIAVLVSGALSGIAGISFAYSISANFSSSIYMGYGYLAIAAMIFGNWTILPTLGSCLLFGFARSGGYYLVQQLGMPSSYSDLVMILPYALTLVLLVFFSKYNRSPRALGEIYDKGKR